MNATNSNSRRNKILEIIIDSYIETAVPVGSKAVSEKFDENLSPATIRNIMAELEEIGYLTHPHTSAGRIPTDKGYRFYVDSIMPVYSPSKDESKRIEKEVEVDEKEELLHRVLKILAGITGETSIILFPKFRKTSLMYIELFPIYGNKVLLLLVTTAGLIKNTIIDLGKRVDEDLLERVSEFLNMQFQGKELDQILPEIKNKIDDCKDSFLAILQLSMDILTKSEFLIDDELIEFEGTSNILKQPEFEDANKAKNVLKALEDEEDILSIIKDDIDCRNKISIHIGSENKPRDLRDCSLVISPYRFSNRNIGALGVIGPTRMEYPKVCGRVSFLAEIISRFLNE